MGDGGRCADAPCKRVPRERPEDARRGGTRAAAARACSSEQSRLVGAARFSPPFTQEVLGGGVWNARAEAATAVYVCLDGSLSLHVRLLSVFKKVFLSRFAPTWCTFPHHLLSRLPDHMKEERGSRTGERKKRRKTEEKKRKEKEKKTKEKDRKSKRKKQKNLTKKRKNKT